MSLCPDCGSAAPLQDAGSLLLHSEDRESISAASELLVGHDVAYTSAVNQLRINYESREKLIHTLQGIASGLKQSASKLAIEVIPGYDAGKPSAGVKRVPMDQFIERLHHNDMIRIIHEGLFTSHLQPIITSSNSAVYGYEFMIRPVEGKSDFQPYRLFQIAMMTGLHSFLDRQARISAIQTSAKLLPKGIKRFINFLPSSIYNPNYCLSHTFAAIEQVELDPGDFIFEVVETERITDMAHLQSIFNVYREHGVKVALDDVGSGFNTLDVLRALKPDYVKIDRSLVAGCDESEDQLDRIKEIIRISQEFGALVLAEGVERMEEFEACKSAGIDLAQGYLFGKPAAEPLPEELAAV